MSALNEWKSIQSSPTLGDIADSIDPGLFAGVGTALEATLAALEVVRNVAEALDLILFLDDPVAAAVSALVRGIQEFLSNFANSGLFFLPLAPTRIADVLHPYTTETALIEAASALNDPLDPNRPQVTETGTYIGVICLAGANVWADFRPILDALDSIFGEDDRPTLWAELAALQLRVYNAEVAPRDTRNARGAPWDWSVVRPFSLLPVVREVYATIISALERLAAQGTSIADVLSKATALIQERIRYIANLAAQLQRLIEFVLALRDFFLNAKFMFFANNQGGVNQIVDDWLNATKRPDFQLSAGFVAMATGANPINDFKKFMSFIGVLSNEVETQLDQLQNRIDAAGEA